MLIIHPEDFDKITGRRKIIAFLHQLEVKVEEMEKEMKDVKGREKKDIENIIETEG